MVSFALAVCSHADNVFCYKPFIRDVLRTDLAVATLEEFSPIVVHLTGVDFAALVLYFASLVIRVKVCHHRGVVLPIACARLFRLAITVLNAKAQRLEVYACRVTMAMIVKLSIAQEVLNNRAAISFTAPIVMMVNQLFSVTANCRVPLVLQVLVRIVGLSRMIVHSLGSHRWQLLHAGA